MGDIKVQRGPFQIGSNVWAGLSKLIEEAGETMQVAGKLMATGGLSAHWDGSDLRGRLLEEMADLSAAVLFVARTNHLDMEVFEARINQKLALFDEWHEARGRLESLGSIGSSPSMSVEKQDRYVQPRWERCEHCDGDIRIIGCVHEGHAPGCLALEDLAGA